MVRHAIDRWADTTAFRVALVFAALGVLPVLFVGVGMTLVGGLKAFVYGWPGELELGAMALPLLSAGGACGFVGYVRALSGMKKPQRHNVTATLVLLTAGVLAAISVAGIVIATVLGAGLPYREAANVLVAAALFAAANLLWAFSGIAWMQRLLHRYRETTGRAFDGLPVVLLFVALALATAAVITTAML
jgi:hypothetical protein